MEYSWVLSEFVRGIPINQAVEWNDTWSWALLTMLTSGTTCGWVCSTPRRSTVFGWTLGRFNSSWRCTSLCHSAELPRANQRISLRMFKRKSAVHTQSIFKQSQCMLCKGLTKACPPCVVKPGRSPRYWLGKAGPVAFFGQGEGSQLEVAAWTKLIEFPKQYIGENSWYRTTILQDVHTDTWWTHDWPAPHFWSKSRLLMEDLPLRLDYHRLHVPICPNPFSPFQGPPSKSFKRCPQFNFNSIHCCLLDVISPPRLSIHTHIVYCIHAFIYISWDCVNFSSFFVWFLCGHIYV